jgi:hypothetical protein
VWSPSERDFSASALRVLSYSYGLKNEPGRIEPGLNANSPALPFMSAPFRSAGRTGAGLAIATLQRAALRPAEEPPVARPVPTAHALASGSRQAAARVRQRRHELQAQFRLDRGQPGQVAPGTGDVCDRSCKLLGESRSTCGSWLWSTPASWNCHRWTFGGNSVGGMRASRSCGCAGLSRCDRGRRIIGGAR